MIRLLFACLFLTLQLNHPKPGPQQSGGWLPYVETDKQRCYTVSPQITSWPFTVTGVQPVTEVYKGELESVRWYSTVRLFPEGLRSRPVTLDLGNKITQIKYYVTQLKDLGNGICEFRLSQEFSLVTGFVGVSQIDTVKYHLGVGVGALDSAYYLPENKKYLAVGKGDLKFYGADDYAGNNNPKPHKSPDFKGQIFDRDSKDSDCGAGFFYHGNLYVVVKLLVSGLDKRIDQAILAVPVPIE